jgi:methylated-DNA-[protein]-cysteine S-methyltransferase
LNLTFGELTQTPVGPISLYAGDAGLQHLTFSPLRKLKQKRDLRDATPSLFGLETIGVLLTELNEYFFGIRKTFSVEIDWNILNGFKEEVLAFTLEIPYGQVRTYGEIAQTLGKPGGARAVGMALGSNPIPLVIPCHRVVGSDGALRGYSGGSKNKAFLLELEGLRVRDQKLIS